MLGFSDSSFESAQTVETAGERQIWLKTRGVIFKNAVHSFSRVGTPRGFIHMNVSHNADANLINKSMSIAKCPSQQ